jgi:hypothetical protein
MRVFRFIGKLIVLAGAAFAGAAAGDLARQRFMGEKGQVFSRSADGEWTISVPPQLLIPGVLAGLRGGERGILRAAAASAMMAATGGKGPGGIAEKFFGSPKQ